MTLTLIHDAPACEMVGSTWNEPPAEYIPAGSAVEYKGHTLGGMVRVKTPAGDIRVIHPATTKELS